MTICFSIFHLLPCRPFSYVKWVSYSTHTIVYILYMILRTVHTVTLFVFIWHREQWGCDERSIIGSRHFATVSPKEREWKKDIWSPWGQKESFFLSMIMLLEWRWQDPSWVQCLCSQYVWSLPHDSLTEWQHDSLDPNILSRRRMRSWCAHAHLPDNSLHGH